MCLIIRTFRALQSQPSQPIDIKNRKVFTWVAFWPAGCGPRVRRRRCQSARWGCREFFLNTCGLCAISCILATVSPFILSGFYVFLAGVDLQVFLFLLADNLKCGRIGLYTIGGRCIAILPPESVGLQVWLGDQHPV